MKNYLSRRNNDLGFGFFDEVFDDFFKPNFFGAKQSAMKTDIKELENGFDIAIDMPGFDKKDVELTLQNGYLKVEAKREENQNDEDNFVRRERSYSCARTYYVGDAIKEEDIKAKYNNGTLELFVPKKQKELPQKKNIQID